MADDPVAPWPERPVRRWAEFSPEEQTAVLARLRARLSPQAKREREVNKIMRRLEFGKHTQC